MKISEKKKLKISKNYDKYSKKYDKYSKMSFIKHFDAWDAVGFEIPGAGLAVVGAFVGFGIGEFINKPRGLSNKINETQISDTTLKIAQDKAINFNEKFGENISVPTTESLDISNVTMQGYTVNSDAVNNVRESVSNVINDKIVYIQTGATEGHISGRAYGDIYGTDGQLLIKDGYHDWVIERMQYLQNELGDSLNNQLVDAVNTAFSPFIETTYSVLLSIGCAMIPGAILCGLPIAFLVAKKVVKKKEKKYAEYKKLGEEAKQNVATQQEVKEEIELEQ